jgi:C-terminal processing protease CtpA/Prc
MLTNDIGYLKVSMFPGNIGIDVANEMEAAIDELGSAKSLVIDVRGNGGGGVGFLRLLNLLTSQNHEVGTFFSRPRKLPETPDYRGMFVLDRIPRYKLQILPLALRFYWRVALCKLRHEQLCVRLETRGKGNRPFHGKVVVLANRHTASASEMFVACAKEQKLAAVVGEPTAGRVRGGTKAKLPYEFRLMLPAGAYKTSHGTTLEGTPIIPDVPIAFDPYSARIGRDVQLERAIEIVSAL